jgi:crotonobetainyl-CoA:carnitine CoA-transferase CaiB-like acyl-CoA transferase
MCALLHRAKTGEGQYIDLSQREACAMLLPEALMDYVMNGTQPPRLGNRDPYMAPHGVFRCQGEDRWVSIVARSDDEWQKMCTAIGQPGLAADARFSTLAARKENEDSLEQCITAWTQGRSAEEATQVLQQLGVPAYPSLNGKDMLANPHVAARGFFVELEHPEVGKRRHLGSQHVSELETKSASSGRPAICDNLWASILIARGLLKTIDTYLPRLP